MHKIGSLTNGIARQGNLHPIIWVEKTVICYISPTGSDSNFDNQLANYGNASQINYPLHSLNKACEFLCRFRAYGTHSHTYEIWCEDGTYDYSIKQDIFHPDCNSVGCFVLIRPRTSLIIGQTPKVVFRNTSSKDRELNDAVITSYCNTSIHMCHLTSVNKLGCGYFDHRITRVQIYGCEFSNCTRAIDVQSNWAHVGSWYNSTDVGTQDNIWQKQTPIYIHDCDIGIVTEGGVCDIGGFVRINTTSNGIIGGRTGTASFSDWRPLRLDVKSLVPYNVWSGGFFDMYLNSTVYTPKINTVRTGMTMTDVSQAFNIPPNQDPKAGGTIYLSDPSGYIQAGLNQDMF